MGISPLLVFGVGVAVSGWIVACGGIASLQSFNLNITFQTGSTVTLSPASWRLSWEWFILSYQFFILVLIGVLGVMKKLRKMHSALNSQLAFVSVLWAIIANNFYQLVRRFDSTEFANALDSAGLYPSVRMNTLIAGACITIIGNFFASFGMYGEDDIIPVDDRPGKHVPANQVPAGAV